jgi:hypothetical protein
MNKRSSRQSLSNKPALATYYENAHLHILGKKCYISAKEYPTFETFMDDLRDLNIGCRDYAYNVTTLLKGWVEKRKFYRIPVPVFCGDWALGKFQTVDKSEYVKIADEDEDTKTEILQSELLIARAYVDGNLKDVCRMSNIVKELKPLLSKAWIDCPKEDRPELEVTDILCKEYYIRPVSSYNAIIKAVLEKQRCQHR